MSKIRIGIAALGVSSVLLAALPPDAALARGLRIGGGPIGIVRMAASRMLGLGGLRGRHYSGRRIRVASAHDTVEALPRVEITRNGDWVGKPVARVQVAAAAALAGWRGRRGTNGWWQHGDGGYGWVGPLFWPFAYNDIYDYTLWGDGMGFWGYGYRDIYAAIFVPYGDDDLQRYMAPQRSRHGRLPSLAQMCGDDGSETVGLPVDQLRQAIQPSDEQRAALDDLAGASAEAARIIRSACPTEAALTASGRLAAMQQRVEAMKSAIATIRPPLEKLYEQLDDEQKRKLTAFADQRIPFAPKVPAAQSCTQPGTFQWPGGELEARLHLNDAQRGELAALQRADAYANNTLNFDCQPDEGLAPPDRLATADTRLDAMLDALKLVRPALDGFYATLNDEQKAQFETIGAKRTS